MLTSSEKNVCIEMATISVPKNLPTSKVMNESGCLLDNIIENYYYCSTRMETASSVEDDVDWVKVEKPEEKDGSKNSFLSFPSYFYEKEIQLTSNSLSSHQQQLLLPESPGRK